MGSELVCPVTVVVTFCVIVWFVQQSVEVTVVVFTPTVRVSVAVEFATEVVTVTVVLLPQLGSDPVCVELVDEQYTVLVIVSLLVTVSVEAFPTFVTVVVGPVIETVVVGSFTETVDTDVEISVVAAVTVSVVVTKVTGETRIWHVFPLELSIPGTHAPKLI